MKPKPFCVLNHLTVPVAMEVVPFESGRSTGAATDGAASNAAVDNQRLRWCFGRSPKGGAVKAGPDQACNLYMVLRLRIVKSGCGCTTAFSGTSRGHARADSRGHSQPTDRRDGNRCRSS